MAKHSEPTKPKKQNRRGNRDLYEVLALFLWLTFLSGTIALIFVSSGNLIYNDFEFNMEKYRELIYVLSGLWVLCSISLYLFDSKSVAREKDNFEYELKMYREKMNAWQERELAEMELEKQRLLAEPSFEHELTQIKKKLEDELENKKKLEDELENKKKLEDESEKKDLAE